MAIFKIDGVSTELEVLSFHGVEAISAPYEFELEVSTSSSQLARAVGQRAHLSWTVGDVATERNGVVGRVTVTGTRRSNVIYQLTLVPGLTALSLRSNCRIFQSQTADTVLSTILDEHAIDYRIALTGDHRERPYLVQFRESDLDFAQRLLEEEGLFYYFEHDRGRHTLVIGDASGAYQPVPGRSTSLAYGERLGDKEQISALALSTTAASERVRLRDYNYESPAANLEVTNSVPRAGYSTEVYDYPGGYGQRNDGFVRARMRLGTKRVATLSATGTSNSPRLQPGRTFRLTGHGFRSANRYYVAVRVTHETTNDGAGGLRPYLNSIECIDANVPHRSMGGHPRLVMRGPQTAVVVGPAGEEIYVDEHGRVKVQFHWDREGASDENSSAWIRVAQTSAGKGWGTLSVPRIGHEVLVDFVNGDPDRPVIVGSLYNGTNRPPADLPAQKSRTILKTESTPGGAGFNELRMDDDAGAEQVFLHAERDFDVEVGGSHTQDVGNDATLTVHGDMTDNVSGDRTVETDGDYTHTVGGEIHLSAAQELRLSVGGTSLVLKANGQVLVNGTNIA